MEKDEEEEEEEEKELDIKSLIDQNMQLRKQAEFKSVKVQEIISEYKNLNKKKNNSNDINNLKFVKIDIEQSDITNQKLKEQKELLNKYQQEINKKNLYGIKNKENELKNLDDLLLKYKGEYKKLSAMNENLDKIEKEDNEEINQKIENYKKELNELNEYISEKKRESMELSDTQKQLYNDHALIDLHILKIDKNLEFIQWKEKYKKENKLISDEDYTKLVEQMKDEKFLFNNRKKNYEMELKKASKKRDELNEEIKLFQIQLSTLKKNSRLLYKEIKRKKSLKKKINNISVVKATKIKQNTPFKFRFNDKSRNTSRYSKFSENKDIKFSSNMKQKFNISKYKMNPYKINNININKKFKIAKQKNESAKCKNDESKNNIILEEFSKLQKVIINCLKSDENVEKHVDKIKNERNK